ncbi:MAG: LptF/LptG family permease [Candidatus Omnitrophota bacterium]|nr:LptF/LptG family permease [Candidatus Omnitrophota bacterium]
MRILDRYIFKTILKTYAFICLVFIGIYFIGDIFSTLSDIFEAKTPFNLIVEYYISMIPLIFLRVSPLSILISVLYTLGEFNKNNEVLSMRASGISRLRIALPILLFAVFLSFASLFIQEKILAVSQKRVEEIKTRFIKKSFSLITEERNIAFASKNMIFFVGSFLPKNKIMKNVVIFEENENRDIEKKTICKTIVYEDGTWIGQNIMQYDIDGEGGILGKPHQLSRLEIPLDENPRDILFKKSIFADFAPLKSIKKQMIRFKKIKAHNLLANLIIEYNRKLADPLSHFFLIIGILPLALEIKKRKAALSSLGVGFIFGFIYYVFGSFSIALGKAGILLPIFSAWLAPLFFLTVGLTGLFLMK